jgi:hypothetical protein
MNDNFNVREKVEVEKTILSWDIKKHIFILKGNRSNQIQMNTDKFFWRYINEMDP